MRCFVLFALAISACRKGDRPYQCTQQGKHVTAYALRAKLP